MSYKYTTRVYYHDTDAYGHVWHGTYLRWCEKGRMEYLRTINLCMSELLEKYNIVIPIVELNLRYKSVAHIDDLLEIETIVTKVGPTSLEFEQLIRNVETGTLCVKAEIKTVATDNNGKLYRKLPQVLCDLIKVEE